MSSTLSRVEAITCKDPPPSATRTATGVVRRRFSAARNYTDKMYALHTASEPDEMAAAILMAHKATLLAKLARTRNTILADRAAGITARHTCNGQDDLARITHMCTCKGVEVSSDCATHIRVYVAATVMTNGKFRC